jgi:beta-glucosidase
MSDTKDVRVDRRALIAGAAAAGAASLLPSVAGAAIVQPPKRFPNGFLWGTATAGHQVEGNNVNTDIWLLENVKPTMFAERSGDGVNSFALWQTDLDLVRDHGLNSYRFSLEWARIEPEPGFFSIAMLDHYKAIIAGCHARGLTPMVTYNHFTTPRWFGAMGGWNNPQSARLFARFCDQATRALGDGIGYATTLNEPNTISIVADVFPPEALGLLRAMNAAGAKACGSASFSNTMVPDPADIGTTLPNLIAGHKLGKAAIKAARGSIQVGVSLAISDDQAAGADSLRDAKRKAFYGAWLDAAGGDDFLGVQNYERAVWGPKTTLPPPPGAVLNASGREVYTPSLANAVRYAHAQTHLPILITEHGVGTDDDRIRADFIVGSLKELSKAIDEGVPVKGYVHWSLLDNFEWIFGYSRKLGLCSVDRTTFRRTPKPSLDVLGNIARRNTV